MEYGKAHHADELWSGPEGGSPLYADASPRCLGDWLGVARCTMNSTAADASRDACPENLTSRGRKLHAEAY